MHSPVARTAAHACRGGLAAAASLARRPGSLPCAAAAVSTAAAGRCADGRGPGPSALTAGTLPCVRAAMFHSSPPGFAAMPVASSQAGTLTEHQPFLDTRHLSAAGLPPGRDLVPQFQAFLRTAPAADLAAMGDLPVDAGSLGKLLDNVLHIGLNVALEWAGSPDANAPGLVACDRLTAPLSAAEALASTYPAPLVFLAGRALHVHCMSLLGGLAQSGALERMSPAPFGPECPRYAALLTAGQLLRTAADLGNARALFNLGLLFHSPASSSVGSPAAGAGAGPVLCSSPRSVIRLFRSAILPLADRQAFSPAELETGSLLFPEAPAGPGRRDGPGGWVDRQALLTHAALQTQRLEDVLGRDAGHGLVDLSLAALNSGLLPADGAGLLPPGVGALEPGHFRPAATKLPTDYLRLTPGMAQLLYALYMADLHETPDPPSAKAPAPAISAVPRPPASSNPQPPTPGQRSAFNLCARVTGLYLDGVLSDAGAEFARYLGLMHLTGDAGASRDVELGSALLQTAGWQPPARQAVSHRPDVSSIVSDVLDPEAHFTLALLHSNSPKFGGAARAPERPANWRLSIGHYAMACLGARRLAVVPAAGQPAQTPAVLAKSLFNLGVELLAGRGLPAAEAHPEAVVSEDTAHPRPALALVAFEAAARELPADMASRPGPGPFRICYVAAVNAGNLWRRGFDLRVPAPADGESASTNGDDPAPVPVESLSTRYSAVDLARECHVTVPRSLRNAADCFQHALPSPDARALLESCMNEMATLESQAPGFSSGQSHIPDEEWEGDAHDRISDIRRKVASSAPADSESAQSAGGSRCTIM
ncbi:hypothetical protein H696_01715 [Fonticula alba]|uniref:Uncharacterized protein n=1 Tax=Fonticula alba TaxID=691883 RepID=A0A058ZD56_FONAL|nr:hypothetical protein H696_01715 [Fonticula alba]KCV72319.1 hypothetical protein H696_01715 [Fonticula alba]|eukprot:XP_009493897.1 hypothetical protein H696_01715 [Fonticula alba]